MGSQLIIEKLSEKNFNDFVSLVEKQAEYEKLEPPNKEAKIRLKRDGLSTIPKFEAYLGKINGKYVSYVFFYMIYSSFLAMPTLFLEDLFVLKVYRKNRIGQKMFDFCFGKAKERKCGRMDFCVISWNKPAIKFFEKNHAKRLNWAYYRIGVN